MTREVKIGGLVAMTSRGGKGDDDVYTPSVRVAAAVPKVCTDNGVCTLSVCISSGAFL